MSDEQKTRGRIFPGLSYEDPEAAIQWLVETLGFRARLVVPKPGGGVLHSELSLGPDIVVMIGGPRPDEKRLSPFRLGATTAAISITVEDPDSVWERAKLAPGRILHPLQDEAYGARGFMIEDPWGHQWYVGDYVPGAHWSDE